MKRAVIYGDLRADRVGDQYPEVNLCDDCYAARKAAKGDSGIAIGGGDYDPSLGACYDCGVMAEEEREAD